MSKLKDSLNQISLNLFLNSSEIKILKTNELFKNAEETEYSYDKNELLLKFITLAIETFKKFKQDILVKCFYWIKKELEINLELKPDIFSLNKIEKMEKSRPSMKMQFEWLKEFSSLNKENNVINTLGNYLKNDIRKSLPIDLYKNPIGKKNQLLRRKTTKNITSNNLMIKLKKLGEPNLNLDFKSNKFNIFEFEKLIRKENILPATGVYVFNYNKLFDLIPYEKFENCVYKIAQGYHRKNPYHNDLHAADILQTIFIYNNFSKFQNILKLTDLDLFSIFFSAIIHDYGHPGLSNNYLIRTKNDLAIKYNDISVLENCHVSDAFNIMKIYQKMIISYVEKI